MIAQLCATDNGYHDTKVKIENRTWKFNSKVQSTNEDNIEGNFLEYEGEKYRIGVGQEDINICKTQDQVHKICTLAALAQTMQGLETQEFKLVVGLPLMHYRNKGIRETFKEYISRPTIQTVRYNSFKKNIIIKDTLVFAQGGAALYADLNRQTDYKNSLVAILDWGGLTINGFIAEQMQPIPETMFTVNLGTLILNNKIRTAINEKLGFNVQDYEIPYLLKHAPIGVGKIINDVQEQHFSELKKEMLKKNWSLETLKIIGVGGGFLVAGEHTHKHLPAVEVSHDPVYANVKGLYNVGQVVL